eukprot:scaffold18489_cov32-Tisochrysis_lutea.AAC.5
MDALTAYSILLSSLTHFGIGSKGGSYRALNVLMVYVCTHTLKFWARHESKYSSRSIAQTSLYLPRSSDASCCVSTKESDTEQATLAMHGIQEGLGRGARGFLNGP